MSKNERFFLVTEKHIKARGGAEVETPNVLYFSFTRPNSIPESLPHVLVSHATKQHIQDYPQVYQAFKELNPSYKLPWGDEKDFLGVRAQQVGETSFVETAPEVKPEVD